MKKRGLCSVFLSALLCVALMLLCLYGLSVNAQASNESFLKYTLNEDKQSYTVSGRLQYLYGPLEIPQTYNGKPVTAIGYSAFYNCDGLTSIVIPDSVTSIESYAFGNCSNVTSITINDRVTSVATDAFEGCKAEKLIIAEGSTVVNKTIIVCEYFLKEVVIPDGVTSISGRAFYGCSNLTNIVIPNSISSIDANAFIDCSSLNYNVYDHAKYLGNEDNPYLALVKYTSEDITSCEIHPDTKVISSAAFYDCIYLTDIAIADSVTDIGNNAFYNCSALVNVTVGDTLTSIGNYAFSNCSNLHYNVYDNANYLGNEEHPYLALVKSASKEITSCEIHPDTKTISNGAFSNCNYLTDITIPDSVTSIGGSAFTNCKSLTDISLPKNLTSIEQHTFSGCSFTGISLPESLSSIGQYAFSDCSNLANIILPDSVTVVADNSFYNCTSLTGITLPDSIAGIGAYAFSNCSNLECVTIGDGVTVIGDYAFCNCTSLTDITVSNSVTAIGNHAFYNCTSLIGITIPASTISIGESAFRDCSNMKSAIIGDGVTVIGEYAFYNCSSLSEITLQDSLSSIKPYAFYGCSDLLNITIPDGVTGIGEYAFYNCSSLSDIILPDHITSIDPYTFFGCSSLAHITLPDSIACIDEYAFSNCSSLNGLTFPNSVTAINKAAFSSCNNLTGIIIPQNVTSIGFAAFQRCQGLTNVTILGGVSSIPDQAFLDCTNLTTVSIPDSVRSIGTRAFNHCSKLEHIAYAGTESSWNNITFYNYNTPLVNASNIHFKTTFRVTENCLKTDVFCPVCEKVVVSISKPNGSHSMDLVITAPTCTQGGYTTYTCSDCGHSYTSDETAALGHSVKNGVCTVCGSEVIKVTVQPANKAVKDGTKTKFTVAATGDQLAYQWQYRTSSSGSWKNVSATSGKNATYSLTAAVRHNGYQYRCRIKDSLGNTLYTNAVTLNVLGIKTQPVSKTVKDGVTVKFTVSAVGKSIKYQWQYRTSSSGSWKTAKATGNTTNTLSVPASISRNGYQYRCRVTDSAGNTAYTNIVTLKVLGIKTQPASKSVVDGKTAKFTVTAIGSSLKYQWQYRTSSSGSWKTAKATGNTTKTLSVPASVSRHGYQYRCKITDSAGNTVYTKAVSLYVLGIKTQPVSKSVKVGATAKFTVAAVGKGLTYQWQYRTSSSGSWKNVSAASGKKATYSLTTATRHNGYQYRCKITDSAGNVIYSNIVKLTVKK